jgi:hypothetical protein
MSIFPIQFLEDLGASFLPLGSDGEDHSAGGDSEGRADESEATDSVMLSGLSTESTTELTMADYDAPSVESNESTDFSIGEHGAVTGIAPGTFVRIYREHMARNAARDHQTTSADAPTTCVSDDGEASGSSFSGTIVSSHPSGYTTNDRHLESSWEISPAPPPRSVPSREDLSISTTESMYRDMSSLEHQMQTDDSSANTSLLSLPRSSSMVATSRERVDSPDESPVRHERVAFTNVANRLALQCDNKQEWFARFTDKDWVAFRHEADMILKAMGSDCSAVIPLPPEPPACADPGGETSSLEYCASDQLPNEFICLLCDDVIVGATQLDCGCDQSTVCRFCWEEQCTSCELDEEDIIQVEINKACPFCNKSICQALSCHALDVAILHCIKSLPEKSQLQTVYYKRLASWRQEVVRRRSQCEKKNVEAEEKLLSDLIAREEEYFYGKTAVIVRPFWQTHKLFLVVGHLALAAAAFVVLLNNRGTGFRGTVSRR